MKRTLLILLCVILLLGLCACGASQEETAATTTPTETTAPPPPTPEEVYAEAVSHLQEQDAMVLQISSKTTLTLGIDTFLDNTTQTLILQGIGSEGFTAAVEQTTNQGSFNHTVSEYYTDGTLYMTVQDYGYTAPLSQADFMDRFIPAQVLDASLYETVEQPAEKSLRFSGATGLEDWLYSEGMELIEASGSVVLNDDGTISRSTYDVSFTYGPAQYDMELSVNIAPDSGEPFAAPENLSEYTQIDDYRAPLLMEQAAGLADQLDTVSMNCTNAVVIEAANLTFVRANQYHTYGQGEDLLADVNYGLAILENGESLQQTENIHYANGVCTYSVDGGEPTESDMEPLYITSLVRSEVIGSVPDCGSIESFTLTELPSFILLEYTIRPDLGEEIAASIVGQIYEDPNVLADLSSGFRTETASGYIGFEKTTGLPVSMGTEYLGYYTIDGTEYRVMESDQNTFAVGHDSTYAAITGEPLPGEPAQSPTPLFYQVTGADGQQMWLMGTIHVGDGRTANLPATVTQALSGSDALAVEFDSEAYIEKVMQDEEAMAALLENYLYTDGSPTKDHIQDQQLYDNAIATLKASGSYNAAALLSKPFLLSQQIDQVNMSWGYRLSSDYGVDNQLMKLARENEIEIRDVESGEAQLDLLANFSDALQELMLKESVNSDHLTYNGNLEELYELWCAGDEAALIKMICEEDTQQFTEEELALYEEYTNAISTDRNDDMLDAAVSYLESGDVVFYAVGLGHLLAEDGLVNTLRDAGYTVELVPSN